jgi:hypothetical protein
VLALINGMRFAAGTTIGPTTVTAYYENDAKVLIALSIVVLRSGRAVSAGDGRLGVPVPTLIAIAAGLVIAAPTRTPPTRLGLQEQFPT